MGFEQIEHTADVGLHVWASDTDELFAEAGRALISVMGTASGPDVGTAEVVLEAPDVAALFVDWLSELLYLFEVRGFVPQRFDVHVDGTTLRATVSGPDAGSIVEEGPAVKAVTFHGLEVSPTEARVYLDV